MDWAHAASTSHTGHSATAIKPGSPGASASQSEDALRLCTQPPPAPLALPRARPSNPTAAPALPLQGAATSPSSLVNPASLLQVRVPLWAPFTLPRARAGCCHGQGLSCLLWCMHHRAHGEAWQERRRPKGPFVFAWSSPATWTGQGASDNPAPSPSGRPLPIARAASGTVTSSALSITGLCHHTALPRSRAPCTGLPCREIGRAAETEAPARWPRDRG